MALSLQATKRRIASVNSTKKITKAMQLVATAKLKSMKKNLESTSLYAEEVRTMISLLFNRIPSDEFSSIFDLGNEYREGKIYLIISSTLGLCGGYNYNLFKEILPEIDKEKDLLVVIGSKGVSYFKSRGYNVDSTFINATSDFSYDIIDKIIKHVLSIYKTKNYELIRIGYTHFKNQITFIPKISDLFPFSSLDSSLEGFTRKEKDMIVEPDPISVVKKLLPLYLKSILYANMNEAFVSEYASRRNAMESATDNAEEIVSSLQIEFNKARQAAITQEITEVVGGANALK